MDDLIKRYTSRKLILTAICVAAGYHLAMLGKMDAHIALLLSTAIGSFNVSNAWISRKSDA